MSSFLEIEVPADWLRRAQAGDAEAQHSLYEALARPVYTLLRRLVARPAIAEELFQEVFLEVLGHLDGFRGTGSFAGWVRSIAVNKALAHLRSPWQAQLATRPVDELASLPAAVPGPGGGDWHADLDRALNALPPLARSIVWLHDVEGYTHAEIATMHGQTASFSKSQLARAHALLRELLEPTAGDPPCTLASRN